MDSGDNTLLRRGEQNSLAIGLLNQQTGARQGRDHGIKTLQLGSKVGLFNNKQSIRVNLFDRDQVGESQGCKGAVTVLPHPVGLIANCVTEVEGSKGLGAGATSTAEHAMGNGQQLAGIIGKGFFVEAHREIGINKKGEGPAASPWFGA